jgi:hypothetical protein
MIYMKILKKGGSREKGEEETKYMPHAPVGRGSKYHGKGGQNTMDRHNLIKGISSPPLKNKWSPHHVLTLHAMRNSKKYKC